MTGAATGVRVVTRLGLYGKLPVHGDFVSRRLPGEFIDPWDSWLQRSIAFSKERLAAGWLDHYLGAPIWRFLVGPGVIGSGLWMGVLVPSVDKVGRYFPLTLACAVEAGCDPVQTFWASGGWFGQCEELGMRALDIRLQFDRFDQDVEASGSPVTVPARARDDDTAPLPRKGPVCLTTAVARPLGSDRALEAATSMALGIREPVVIWGMEDAESGSSRVLCTEGLPSGERFCAMLDQYWDAHGWESYGAVGS